MINFDNEAFGMKFQINNCLDSTLRAQPVDDEKFNSFMILLLTFINHSIVEKTIKYHNENITELVCLYQTVEQYSNSNNEN